MWRTDLPKITIVTPSYNQGHYIEETICSVIEQKYPNLEFFVIDGGSKDQTVSILKKYQTHITFWVSEPDEGQADAINKGFQLATGEICGYLNSDDLLLPNSLHTIAKHFQRSPISWLSGAMLYGESIETADTQIPYIRNFQDFVMTMTIPQQATFWAATAMPKPYFDKNFHFRMDHDFFIRLYKKHGPPKFIQTPLSFFRFHDQAKTTLMKHVSDQDLQVILEREIEVANNELKKQLLHQKELLTLRKPLFELLQQPREGSQLLDLFKILLHRPKFIMDRFYLGAVKRILLGKN